MTTLEYIGRQDIADLLGAEIISAQEISAFERPPIFIPRYSAKLKRIGSPIRVESFGKGMASQIDDGGGLPTFAELLVCRRFKASGWDAVWASMFGGLRFIHSWPWDIRSPIEREKLPNLVMDKIETVAFARCSRKNCKTSFSGISDVIAWRNDEIIMIECKWAGNDSLGSAQEEWLYCAHDAFLTSSHLGVFEWYFEHEEV